MITALANPYDLNLKRFLWYSAALHGAVVVAAIVSALFHWHGNEWAGVGGEQGGVQVKLVSSAGIPMPRPTLPTDSQTVDPTQGLYKVEPPKLEQPPPDATKIPTFKKDKPLPPSPKSKVFEKKTPPPDNAVPYGEGGAPNLPTGYSQTPGASSGVTIQGQGGGDFASRYGFYIENVKRRIYSNWSQWSIDQAGRNSRTIHCAVTFTINRDGSIRDAKISQSSGNYSYDSAALHAVANSNPVEKLPTDYSGSYVVAIIDFNPPGIQ
jgi:TonB family protein